MVVIAPMQSRLLSTVTEASCLNVFMAKLVADTPQKPARAHMARLIAQKMPKVYPAPAVQLAQCACAEATLTTHHESAIGLQCRFEGKQCSTKQHAGHVSRNCGPHLCLETALVVWANLNSGCSVTH